jgi:hypothetical protein
MVMKKSPAEKLMNQITKTQLRLDLLNTKLKQENSKGHNFLPPYQIYKFDNNNNVKVLFDTDDKQLEEILKPKNTKNKQKNLIYENTPISEKALEEDVINELKNSIERPKTSRGRPRKNKNE